MDYILILTIIATGITIIATILGAVYFITSLFKADMNSFEGQLSSDMNSFKNELRSDMRFFQGEMRAWKDEINKEMKDFHGRLCSLEGRMKTDP